MVKDRENPMANSFHSFALVGRDTDARVADSMRTLAGHLSQARRARFSSIRTERSTLARLVSSDSILRRLPITRTC